MGIQINGSTDRITAIDGTIDFVSNIGNIGLITASNYVLQDSITIGAGSTVIKTVNGKLGIGTDNPTDILDVYSTTDPTIRSRSGSSSVGALMEICGGSSNDSTLFLSSGTTKKYQIFRDGSQSDDLRIYDTVNALDIMRYRHGGYLHFGVNGEERLRIKSDGKVGIGTNNPSSWVHIQTVSTTGDEDLIRFSRSQYEVGKIRRSAGAMRISGEGNLYLEADYDNDHTAGDSNILFNIDNDEKVRIDSLGNLLVGTTTEGNTNTQITVADSGNAGITIRSGTSNWGVLYFSDATSGADEYRGAVQYNQTSDYLMFRTASAERLRINSVGNVSIGGADPLPHHTGYNGATLHLYQSGSSNVGGELRFTTGASGHTVSDGGYIAYWTDNNMYCNIKESGNWIFYTANTERLRIHSDGKISTKGITNPQGVFCVDTGSGATQGNTLELRRDSTSDYHAVSFFTGSTCDWSVGQNNAGSFDVYENGSDATTRLEVREGGDVKVNSGDLIIGTSGKGIDFSANPDGSRSISTDGNKFDEYEEGTFTPQLNGMGTVSYDLRAGRYTKIGNVVYFQIRINLASRTGGSHAHITNMPFTQSAATIANPHATFFEIQGVDLGGDRHPVAQFQSSEIYLYSVGYESSANYSAMDENQIKNSSQWGVFGFYFTAT